MQIGDKVQLISASGNTPFHAQSSPGSVFAFAEAVHDEFELRTSQTGPYHLLKRALSSDQELVLLSKQLLIKNEA